MSTLRLPTSGLILTKQQLAQHLGRSERWIELRVRDGMPSIPPSRRYACRRFHLQAVERWLAADQHAPQRPLPERIALLETQLAELTARIHQLEEQNQ